MYIRVKLTNRDKKKRIKCFKILSDKELEQSMNLCDIIMNIIHVPGNCIMVSHYKYLTVKAKHFIICNHYKKNKINVFS